MSDSLQPYGLQQARLLCPSLSPRVCSDSCPLSPWCYLSISFAATSFSFCLQSFPASRSFPMSQLFTSRGQSTGASATASVLPMNIQGWFPLGLTGLISLLFKDSVFTCPKSVLHAFICEVPPKELIFSHIIFSLGLNLHFAPQSLNSLAR